MSGRRNEDLPHSGVPGINWNKDRRKWAVKIKVRGRDIYKGLYADLDEAKRVAAAERLEHDDPHGRGHDDTTAHLTDAEIAERFALDDDGDPVWREKPLVGSEPEIREAARWNSRHAGKKLDERAKFLGSRHMWRNDIIARLVALRDAQKADEPDPVAMDWKQTPRMPQEGDYEGTLAEAQAIEDPLRREAQARALEGEIIPPSPIGKGPLALMLMETKREYGLNQRELYVLSSGKDPFEQDGPLGHTLGRWLKVRLDLHAWLRKIHLRGLHYLLVAVQATKPDGTPYENTKEDYRWLNDRVAKAARWLGYIDFDDIVDERNEEVIPSRKDRASAPLGFAYIVTGYGGVALPDPLSVRLVEAFAGLSLKPEERFCFAAFGEKSSLKEVLEPWAERHDVDLFIATGELSDTRAWQMARDAVRDGRKLICFTFSDFDPAGMQMPVSIAVKLMAQQVLQFPDFQFAIQPVALTLEDVIRLRLPTAMVDKKDTRARQWQKTFAPPLIAAGLLPASAAWSDEDEAEFRLHRGRQAKGSQRRTRPLAQVEIDALAALNPQELGRMADAAIAPYLDATLARRVQEAKDAWTREAQRALDLGVNRERLNTMSSIQQFPVSHVNRLLEELRRAKSGVEAIEEAMRQEALRVALPAAPDLPEPDGERSETAKPLVDSAWGYLGMVEALKARKKYEDED